MGRIKDGVYFWSSSPGGGTVGGATSVVFDCILLV